MKRKYYIVLETDNKIVSDIIETYNNLDTVVGLVREMCILEEKYESGIIIINWKRLNKHWWERKNNE